MPVKIKLGLSLPVAGGAIAFLSERAGHDRLQYVVASRLLHDFRDVLFPEVKREESPAGSAATTRRDRRTAIPKNARRR